jgi:hypothetical protein
MSDILFTVLILFVLAIMVACVATQAHGERHPEQPVLDEGKRRAAPSVR